MEGGAAAGLRAGLAGLGRGGKSDPPRGGGVVGVVVLVLVLVLVVEVDVGVVVVVPPGQGYGHPQHIHA